MIPILIDGPAVEPVSLPEMAAYLRLDDEAEHELVAALIKAARLLVEAASRRALIAQRWQLTLDAWPQGRALALPVSPVISVAGCRSWTPRARPWRCRSTRCSSNKAAIRRASA